MKRTIIILCIISATLTSSIVFAANPEIKIDKKQNYNPAKIKKILVLPSIHSVIAFGVKKEDVGDAPVIISDQILDSIKKLSNYNIIAKNAKGVWSDILLMAIGTGDIPYDINNPQSMTKEDFQDFFRRAKEVGVDSVIMSTTSFEGTKQHVPGYSIPYTTYNYSNIYGVHGYIGQIQIPQQNYVNIPDQENEYIHTGCYIGIIDLNSNEIVATSGYYLVKLWQGDKLEDMMKKAIDTNVKGLFK